MPNFLSDLVDRGEYFSDEEWARIQRLLFGDHVSNALVAARAREAISERCRFYSAIHRLLSEVPNRKAILVGLKDIQKKVGDLKSALAADGHILHFVIWAARKDEYSPNNSPLNETGLLGGEDRLHLFQSALEAMERWAAHALSDADATVRRRTRRRDESLDELVRGLAKIWDQCTGRSFDRSIKRGSAKDFVSAVVQVAGPSIGRGSIDEAMKRVIEARRKGGGGGEIESGGAQ